MAWQPLSKFLKTEIAMSPVVRLLRVVIAIVLVIIAIYWIWQAIEAWNAYPYCKTVLTNPGYMKENFVIKIESFYKPSRGEEVNVHELTPEVLKQVEVIQIDIAKDEV